MISREEFERRVEADRKAVFAATGIPDTEYNRQIWLLAAMRSAAILGTEMAAEMAKVAAVAQLQRIMEENK